MDKGSWFFVIILLMLVGAALAGLGILGVCNADNIAPAIVLIWIGLAGIAGGICMLRWYLKNRKELEAPGRIENASEWKTQTSVKTKKVCRVTGKWMLWIAGIILCINVTSRIVASQKTKEEYVQVMGTVTKVYVTTEQKYSRAAKGMVESTTYDVRIEYQPLGDILPNSIAEDLNDKYSEGDIVPVIYKKDAVYDGYIAEKDWLTGAYLPITKYYNVPFVMAIILFVIGFLLYTNSPILDWYLHDSLFK